MLSDIEEKQKTANDEQKDNYEAMKIALDCAIILAKRYKPRRIKGNVTFGREDPYETGKILAKRQVSDFYF